MNRSGYSDAHAVEARLASRLVAGMSATADALPRDVSERLRAGRVQALLRVRHAKEASHGGVQVSGVSASGAALLAAFSRWPLRFAQVLPLFLMVAGLLTIENWMAREQVLAVADIDLQLLTDSLPPSAYSDPGFAEFLRSAPTQ